MVRLIQFEMERMIANNRGQLPNVREFNPLASSALHAVLAKSASKSDGQLGATGSAVRVDLRTSQNRQQSVNVSSQADAKALISTLEQLQFRTS